MYPLSIQGEDGKLDAAAYRVEKMKYGKRGQEKDLTTIIYNSRITVTGEIVIIDLSQGDPQLQSPGLSL